MPKVVPLRSVKPKNMGKFNFHSSYLKIDRAKRHINELNSCLGDFIKTDFYSLRIDENLNTGDNVLQLVKTKDIPNEVPLMIGDAVHNLRTALDFAACEIVRSVGGSYEDVHFPFHQTRDNLIEALKKGGINIACPQVCDFILNNMKPYETGNYALWGLNRLDRLDKHRLLIPVIAVTILTGVSVEDDNEIRFDNLSMKIGDDGTISHDILFNTLKIHIKSYGKPTFEIFFGKDQVFEGKPVIPTLLNLADTVSDCINLLSTI